MLPEPTLMFILFYMYGCFACMYVCTVWVQRSEEEVGSSGTGVTDGCELPCGCWEPNSGPLEEQAVPLSAEAFPSVQSSLL